MDLRYPQRSVSYLEQSYSIWETHNIHKRQKSLHQTIKEQIRSYTKITATDNSQGM